MLSYKGLNLNLRETEFMPLWFSRGNGPTST